eukprot:TRINITY_DN2333_c0_g1_i2.p2 TRINITY_DN2333_c0_g1~~TRINITY_DN2333_c0_g1_i2.p2  ORF type:complete len:121 (-),score=53.55 TRINITY_DN2333_c0_g1_i2:284-646(-)
MVKGKAFRKGWKETRKGTHQRASARVKSINRGNFEKRQKDKLALTDAKLKEAQLIENRKEVKRQKHKKKEEKKKRKEENALKAGNLQVIQKTDKIRKWHKNAKKQLMTLGPEQIERLLKK